MHEWCENLNWISLPDARWGLGVGWGAEQAQKMPGGERVVSVHSNATKFKRPDGSGGIQLELKTCWNSPKISIEPEKKPEKGLMPQQYLPRLNK